MSRNYFPMYIIVYLCIYFPQFPYVPQLFLYVFPVFFSLLTPEGKWMVQKKKQLAASDGRWRSLAVESLVFGRWHDPERHRCFW